MSSVRDWLIHFFRDLMRSNYHQKTLADTLIGVLLRFSRVFFFQLRMNDDQHNKEIKQTKGI